jgi:hypothetical protein
MKSPRFRAVIEHGDHSVQHLDLILVDMLQINQDG